MYSITMKKMLQKKVINICHTIICTRYKIIILSKIRQQNNNQYSENCILPVGNRSTPRGCVHLLVENLNDIDAIPLTYGLTVTCTNDTAGNIAMYVSARCWYLH